MAARTPEALLHDLWQHVLFQTKALRTYDGQPIRIVHPGVLNLEEGPDFLNAQLYLGETRWYGSVEVHVRSRDWNAHGHHQDARYNSVILHVVLEADTCTGRLRRADGSTLPELILAPYLTHPLRALLYAFYRRPKPVLPCATQWLRVPEAVRTQWLETMGYERLTTRAAVIRDRLREVPADQVLYERLLTTLGYAPNAEPMHRLAQSLPLSWLRMLPTQEDVEAALLGMAGLLSENLSLPCDVARWQARFRRLQSQLPATPLTATLWQQRRIRPSNQPWRRLMQAAVWLGPQGWLRHEPLAQLQEALQAARPLSALRRLLQGHRLGRSTLDRLILNAILPVLYALHVQPERILALLQQMPAESDRIVHRFGTLGYRPENAFFSQALHQLYRSRCVHLRCLQCTIGRYLIGYLPLNPAKDL